jgi:hypothetical protein
MSYAGRPAMAILRKFAIGRCLMAFRRNRKRNAHISWDLPSARNPVRLGTVETPDGSRTCRVACSSQGDELRHHSTRHRVQWTIAIASPIVPLIIPTT